MQTSRNEDEELRGRFTIWLEKTLLRKRNKYLARMQAPYIVVLYPQYRKLLIMLYVHQLKPSEISKLGYCKGTHQLYSIKYRILQELRAALSSHESN